MAMISILKGFQQPWFMNKLSAVCCAILLGAANIFSSCDGECNESPDLIIPELINGQVVVANEYRHTVVGGFEYPFGTTVFLNNTVNEFFSLVRMNPVNGWPIVFYWNIHSPPPFFLGAPPPYHFLQPGEVVLIHRCVLNQAFPDFDCLTGTAGPSKTEVKVIVKVENGEIIDEQVGEQVTPSIPPGEYRVVSFPVVINQYGIYELIFTTNSDGTVEERDGGNNVVYLERPNLGAGG